MLPRFRPPLPFAGPPSSSLLLLLLSSLSLLLDDSDSSVSVSESDGAKSLSSAESSFARRFFDVPAPGFAVVVVVYTWVWRNPRETERAGCR